MPYAARAGTVADGAITTPKLNITDNIDLHGWGLNNALRIMAPTNADNFDLLYEQNSNLWLKSGATSGAVHVGARGNVPLDMHGNSVLNAGNLLTDPNGASIRYWTVVVDTDGNCRAQINFPTAFSSSLYSLVATNGDFDAASFAVEVARWNTSGFVAQIRKLDGTSCQNSHVRINYIAIGK